jgi:hypothetical protein
MAENYDQILENQYGGTGTAGSASSTLYGYDRSQVGQLEAERERLSAGIAGLNPAAAGSVAGPSVISRIAAINEMVQSGVPIYDEDISSSINEVFAAGSEGQLAMDMFMRVPGAYRDVSDVFLEDGSIDPTTFFNAIGTTLEYAQQYGPEGLVGGETSVYLDVLMNNLEKSPEELVAAFTARKAEIDAERRGGGRIVNYIDPVALADAAKGAFSSVTGRRATKQEQQAFVKQIHGLQASGATGIDVAGRAEAAAREGAPEEAAAMDYAGAATLVMQALGMR